MTAADVGSGVLLVLGAFFFLAGTVGLLRFPDVYSRLHAITKADTLGLGMITLGLALQAQSLVGVVKLGLAWVLVLISSAINSQLIARAASQSEDSPWKR